MNLKDFLRTIVRHPLVVRAFHTFIQAFLAVWLVSNFSMDKVTLTAAIAAGISALKTMLVSMYEARG